MSGGNSGGSLEVCQAASCQVFIGCSALWFDSRRGPAPQPPDLLRRCVSFEIAAEKAVPAALFGDVKRRVRACRNFLGLGARIEAGLERQNAAADRDV